MSHHRCSWSLALNNPRTLNPLRRSLSAGGSSGGEGALVAFGGTPLGVGTDLGGSLRIPASAHGFFALRPSLGRFPTGGCTSGLAGQEGVNSVNGENLDLFHSCTSENNLSIGPMARNFSDLNFFAKSVVDASPWLVDSKALPIPWRTISLPPRLKFGIIMDDGIVAPTPPVQRALKFTCEKLRAAGHELIEWPTPEHAQAVSLLVCLI